MPQEKHLSMLLFLRKNDLNEKNWPPKALGAPPWREMDGICRVILLPQWCSWNDQLYTKIDLRILSSKKTTRRAADMLLSNQKFANETLEVQTTMNM